MKKNQDKDFKITKEFVLEKLIACRKIEPKDNYKRHIKILNTSQNVICVPMINIRKIAKEILRCNYDYYLKKAKSVKKDDEFYEETLVQGLVIAGLKDLNKQVECIKWLIIKIDNWSTCDSTVSTMKTLKNSKNKSDYFEFYLSLCYSSDVFAARFGIVCLMTYFLENKFIDQILDMCQKVKNDAYYVQMALAWLLSYSFINFKDKTYSLLEKKVLAKFVQNKAISKCRDSFRVSIEDKEKLKEYRIK